MTTVDWALAAYALLLVIGLFWIMWQVLSLTRHVNERDKVVDGIRDSIPVILADIADRVNGSHERLDGMATTHERLTDALLNLERAVDVMGVTNIPREGMPEAIEACWEDVGIKGRFLTDLGGMSIKFQEQMLEAFYEALNKPMPATPAAGSYCDVMVGLDEFLTEHAKDGEGELVLVRRKK